MNRPNYIRLDDDVSFQILRTNPKLTTNTKLMYDGENLYMEAYPATPLLSTLNYKHSRVWKTGLFNRDIRNFLLGTNTTAYEVGSNERDTVILDNFDNQFENMYWSGVESINSDEYPQEMGCIAPLYIRKKLPNYFVIFKIDTPANTNLTADKEKIRKQKALNVTPKSSLFNDEDYDFNSDIKNKIKIIKSFDLREGTPIGDYIKRYIEQSGFVYDQSIYVNFSSNEIYYYGIDRKSGVLTQKVENFKEQLLDNDNTIMKNDDWITSGFERNNLIFPYIMNIEFLFDDDETEEYQFARYFGMYCNDIDLYEVDFEKLSKSDESENSKNIFSISDIEINKENINYIKDKRDKIYSISPANYEGGELKSINIDKNLKLDDVTGFELETTSTYAERINGFGNAILMFKISNANCGQINIYEITDDSDNPDVIFSYNDEEYEEGETTTDIAEKIANQISESEIGLNAYTDGDIVIVEAPTIGSMYNDVYYIDGYDRGSIEEILKTSCGGTDVDGCMFKVYTSEKDVFFDDNNGRYIKCTGCDKHSKVLYFIPYIYNGKISDEYSILVTDNNGEHINVTRTDQIEILDKFYSKIGVLSMFPVKDFDFDTISSPYGDYSLFDKEFKKFIQGENNQEIGDSDSDSDFDGRGIRRMIPRTTYTFFPSQSQYIVSYDDGGEPFLINSLLYERFYDDYGNSFKTEYDYYCENILPELSVISKTTPYIAKWSYVDGSKDSCENPYRLNMSKIFDTCNFSANTFMQKNDIVEFTHSMPYYVVYDNLNENDNNEYHYIPISVFGDGTVEDFFKTTVEDRFDKVFGDLSLNTRFKNKRYNKKYSRFLFGNDAINSSTLFRGVKFEIEELDGGKKVKTGKYNDYKFSFLYVPVTKNDSKKHIVFVKNDYYKFIVGIVYFNIESNRLNDFNKSYVYGIKIKKPIENNKE